MRWVAVLVLMSPGVPARAAEVPDFNRDVRPILAARCFKCHGPDDAARKAKLRLDRRDDAELVLGKPDKSELVRRITSDNAEEVMPPPSLKTPLTAKEKETLRAWVAAGAKYDPHWAFVPPRRADIPATKHQTANPIDNFIFSRLEKEGLKPSPQADKYTLVRRVYLDLIGIPPTPEEVEAFVKDGSPDAYEKLVDKLLASPHYGERWARKWLDLARYADTNGYEKDRQRSIWPYRDWLIKALNDDMPFDRFTLEQLAGDMLPNAGRSQRVASGFHRNTMLNEEGGIDPLEFRYYAVVDRVATTGTTWLGLTVGCAQCHTHKFDPITHTEYFRLFAFLNNADEPELRVPSDEMQKQQSEIDRKLRELTHALGMKADKAEFRGSLLAWDEEKRKSAIAWKVLKPAKLDGGPHTKLTIQGDGSIMARGDAMKQDRYTLTLADLPAGTTAIRIEALPDDSLPARGPGRAYYEGPKGDFLLGEITLTVDGKPVKFATATEMPARPNTPAAKAFDGNTQTGWACSGNQGKPSWAVFVLAEPLASKAATLDLVFERHYAASLGRFRVSATATADAKASEFPGELEDALAIPREKRTGAQNLTVMRYWMDATPEFKADREEIEKLRKPLPNPPTTLVMQERPADNPRATFRHHRGEFLHPKEKVEPGVPAVLPGLPKGEPANRLTFAKWLVSRDNPLTARVTVNRHWHALFGRGLVRTLDDFGYQGETPMHPELLDWLALEFIDRGWSVKKLHKLIVTSATYRQSSHVTPELLAKDAENKLLARGPRVRLEAEQIRDSALKAAGLLSAKMYGPSVFPPQPPNITTEGAYGRLEWRVSDGEDRYRRGLYTFAKRTAPYAMGGTFDAPSGEACLARREVTNTALQALTMLNDAVLLDVARALAKRAVEQKGKTEDRVTLLFRLCLVRPPSADELARIAKFYEAQRTRFATDPDRADAVAGAGDNAADRAAWTATARAILNLDEFVTKE
jgi:hypothetical protein